MSPVTRLILASRSAARRAILADLGVDAELMDSGVDEQPVKDRLLAEGGGPAAVAAALAAEKALAVSRMGPGLVIGADQTLDLDGQLFDKAADLTEARARLMMLRGRTHALHSAVALARDGQVVWAANETAHMHMRAFSAGFLDDYLAAEGEALLGSVGCYRLEGPGAQLFERVEGDYFTILGLPLWPLLAELRRQGALKP